MSVPPRTGRDRADWKVSGESPTPAREHKSDRLGLGLVGIVLVALLVAMILLLLL